MSELALSTVAFSIVFLLVGAAGTYLRRTGPNDTSPVFLEVLGWASGGMMLAWLGIVAALERYGPQAFESLSAVFVFTLIVYGSTAAITILLLKRLNRITDSGSSGTRTSANAN